MLAISVLVIFTACVIILFYFLVDRFKGFREGWNSFIHVLQPFFIGFAMAFLMNPIMGTLEGWLLKPLLKKPRSPESELKVRKYVRTFTTLLSLIILMGVISMFAMAVIPNLISTGRYLYNHIEDQIYGILDWANEMTRGRYKEAILGAKDAEVLRSALNTFLKWGRKYLNMSEEDQLVSFLTGLGLSVGRFLVDTILGMIVAVYVLVQKEFFKGQVKKIIFALFRTSRANRIVAVIRKANTIFYGFIIGKIIDSIIIGLLCYICMSIMNMPYTVLCSFIIGITNIIPVFGPYFGAVPTVAIIFLTNPMKGIYFLIFVFILQQVDGNIIGPKILGDSTGLSSFWVLVAIVVGGGFFGLPGMILGVPVMALIYYLCMEELHSLLRRKNMPEDTASYINAERVVHKTHEIIQKDAEIIEEREDPQIKQ